MKAQILKRFDEDIAALERELYSELPKEIQRAREFGDLRENAEYSAAKERQSFVQARIAMLQRRRNEVALMNLDRVPHDKAGFCSTITLRESGGPEFVYQLVMPEDADAEKGLISTSSPIGRALLNKEEGDVVTVATPGRHAQVRDHQARHASSERVSTAWPEALAPSTICYSPERPTAVIVSGAGADGAYHAGVLKALHEAGVKVDLVAGRGIGAFAAVLFAVDGAAPLWEPTGFWHKMSQAPGYRLRWPYRLTSWALVASAGVLVSPLVLLLGALVVWPIAVGAGLLGLDQSRTVAQGYGDLVAWAFAPDHVPSWVARLILLVASSLALALAIGAAIAAARAPRRQQGNPFWRLLGAPVDSAAFASLAVGTLWDLMRGGATVARPTAADLSQRAAEMLASSVNQPGHRDLLLAVHDLDARRDLVFGLVAGEAGKRLFPGPTGPAGRRAEAFDLGTCGQSGPRRRDQWRVDPPRRLRAAPHSFFRRQRLARGSAPAGGSTGRLVAPARRGRGRRHGTGDRDHRRPRAGWAPRTRTAARGPSRPDR